MTTKKFTLALLACILVLFAAGCKKKAPAPPPPPPPPPPPAVAPKPPAPVISFTAEPSTIQRGSASTLRWNVRNADTITIDQGIGTVPANGSRQVYPNDSTTYTIRASGPGGSDSATARVSVTEAPPPPSRPAPAPSAPKLSLQERLQRDVTDVFFNYDKYDVREDARSQLTRNADALKAIFSDFPGSVVTVEGHCDERGSAEYNLGLGDRRSSSTKDFLVQLGVPADRLKTVSYGKERPQCQDANEDCYQKNRRAHFSSGQ